MAVVGTPRTFDKKFAFQLAVDQFSWTGFSKCSELKLTIAQIKHYEGGTLLPEKSLGRGEFADVTLERGATRNDRDFYVWASQALSGSANLGVKETAYKRNADLVQLDRDGEVLKRYTLFGCMPVEYVAGEWDNSADENVIEKMVLAYDYFIQTA
jgi:phage tail-like protein